MPNEKAEAYLPMCLDSALARLIRFPLKSVTMSPNNIFPGVA